MNVNFKTARRLVMIFMIASLVCALIGMVLVRPGTEASIYIVILSLVLMLLALLILFGLCRCPWCGKRITAGMMKVEVCPHCKRDIETGMKRKGKGKKK